MTKYRADSAVFKRMQFNFIQNLGGGQYGDYASFKDGNLGVWKNLTLENIRWWQVVSPRYL